MTLNAYLALAGLVILLLSPLLLVTSPIWLTWVGWQLMRRKQRGYKKLWPFMVRTTRNYAVAMIEGDPPGGDWNNVPRNLDRYLAEAVSPRIWRIRLVLTLMEVAPLLRFRPLFSMMGEAGRKAFVEKHVTEAGGVLRIVAIGRQLIRMGYYATPEVQDEVGFVPMERRAAWKHQRDRELTRT
jgi:hypothetical protein